MQTPSLNTFLLWCLGAYLAGSIPFGLILVKLAGKGDVRAQGSGNIGATNVLRTGGRGLGLATLVLDAAKGFLPVFLARHFGGFGGQTYVFCAWIVLAAAAGHIFTPWLKFQGGKGVATALGACLGYHAPVVLPPLGVFILLVAVFRYISLGSIAAAIALVPAAIGAFGSRFSGIQALPEGRESQLFLAAWVLLAGLVVRRHAANIQRLLNGTESKLWGGPKERRDA